MKRFFALVISFFAFALLSGTALGATKQAINIPRAVTVGATTLAPGNYDVEWSGEAAVVQVTFMKDKKMVVTSPARLVSETNKLGGVSIMNQDGADTLKSVRTKNASLYFDVPVTAAK